MQPTIRRSVLRLVITARPTERTLASDYALDLVLQVAALKTAKGQRQQNSTMNQDQPPVWDGNEPEMDEKRNLTLAE
eukprot:6418347-Amphidinium_carterae.2